MSTAWPMLKSSSMSFGVALVVLVSFPQGSCAVRRTRAHQYLIPQVQHPGLLVGGRKMWASLLSLSYSVVAQQSKTDNKRER